MLSFKILALAALFNFLACSGPQVGDDDKIIKLKGENEEVAAGAATDLSIQDGDLAGATLAIPADSLPEGSKVNMRSTTTPSEFQASADVVAASSALSISAKDGNGDTIDELANPMTIQIPVAATELALAVEQTKDNMCAFLKTSAGDKFVWRRSAVSIKENIVSFESKLLGIFMLSYCGKSPLEGFSEADATEVAGAASTDLLVLTIPANAIDLGHKKMCVGVISGVDDDNGDDGVVWGFTQVAASIIADQEIKVKLLPGRKIADMPDTATPHIFTVYQEEDDKCDLENSDADGNVEFLSLLTWRESPATFKAGTVSKTLGDSGDLKFSKIDLKVKSAKSDGTALATPTAQKACIQVENKGGDGGFTEHHVNFSEGKINGLAVYSVLYSPSSGEDNFEIFFNTDDCRDGNVDDSTSDKNIGVDQPYRVSFPNFDDGATSSLALAPVEMKVNISEATTLLGFDYICVSMYPNDVVASSLNEDEQYEKSLISMHAKVGEAYGMYVPYESDEVYASYYKALKKPASCRDKPSDLVGGQKISGGRSGNDLNATLEITE